MHQMQLRFAIAINSIRCIQRPLADLFATGEADPANYV